MSYSSVYPPAHSDTYVKATTKYNTYFWPYYATDPSKSVIGPDTAGSWVSAVNAVTNQRFHIDLGSAKIIKRIYYENYHDSGDKTYQAVKNFTFWGSNTESAFLDLVYGNDANWTQLTTSASVFDQHVAQNIADPKYITVTNTTGYRYYALKFADGWGGAVIGVRRIELQIEELTVPSAPTNVSATDNLADKVTITWTAGVGETGGHRVYRDGIDISGIVAHGTNTYDDITGIAGVTYSYTVKAINDAGLSEASVADNGIRIIIVTTNVENVIPRLDEIILTPVELVIATDDPLRDEQGNILLTEDGLPLYYEE